MNELHQKFPAILRRKEVEKRIGLSKSSIYDRLNRRSPRFDATFPKPVKLGVNAIGFVEFEVGEWISARINAREVQ